MQEMQGHCVLIYSPSGIPMVLYKVCVYTSRPALENYSRRERPTYEQFPVGRTRSDSEHGGRFSGIVHGQNKSFGSANEFGGVHSRQMPQMGFGVRNGNRVGVVVVVC
jgi:hypothetical protein